MEFKLTLALPRDNQSVPVARRVLKNSLQVLGVRADVVSDIELALTEACTNVLDHAGDADEYEVSAGVEQHLRLCAGGDRTGRPAHRSRLRATTTGSAPRATWRRSHDGVPRAVSQRRTTRRNASGSSTKMA